MIGNLARKRTNVVAVAALLALVAAMFAAMAPARAATGDVSAGTGYCLATTTTITSATRYYVSTSSSGQVNLGNIVSVEVPDRGDDDDQPTPAPFVPWDDDATTTTPDQIEIPCAAGDVNKFVKVTPNGTQYPNVAPQSHELAVSLSAAATPGTTVTVRAYVKNAMANTTYARSAGESAFGLSSATGVAWVATISSTTVLTEPPAAGATGDAAGPWRDLALRPTASGEYTVTLVGTATTGSNPATLVHGSHTFTAGATAADVATKVASATLELDYQAYDDATTLAPEAKKETGTTTASDATGIWLKLSIKNSAGDLAANADISSVTILAPGGVIDMAYAKANGQRDTTNTGTATESVSNADPDQRPGANTAAQNTAFTASGATPATEVRNTMFVKVSRAANALGAQTPGKVSVEAIINGSLYSNAETLTFTGPTAALELSGTGKTLKSKNDSTGISFTVMGMDAAENKGTAVSNGSLIITIKDSAGAVVPSTRSPMVTDQAQGTGTNAANVTFKVKTGAVAAASGAYTVEAHIAGNAKSKASAAFSVAGPAANIALSADPESADEPGLATLTAMVTDEAGVNVPDGTTVKFSALGGGASLITAAEVETVDGKATASLAVTSYGTTVVYATAGKAAADLSFVSTANEPEAAPEPEPETVSLDCLSNLTQFSAYTCGVDSLASELFALLSTRGATAIHLNSGGSWVRYSIVDGSEVPGSSDFVVTTNDILYISN